MRRSIDIHDLYRERRCLVEQLKAGEIIQVEDEGQIIARIEPIRQAIDKKSPPGRKAAGLRTT